MRKVKRDSNQSIAIAGNGNNSVCDGGTEVGSLEH